MIRRYYCRCHTPPQSFHHAAIIVTPDTPPASCAAHYFATPLCRSMPPFHAFERRIVHMLSSLPAAMDYAASVIISPPELLFSLRRYLLRHWRLRAMR